MTASFSTQCARCGGAVSAQPVHDGKGNAYCQACMERLSGLGLHASAAGHACALCETSFVRADDASGKGNYCPDCLARLRGERPRRRVTAAASDVRTVSGTIDRAFDQMLEEVFRPGAMAGEAQGQLAMAG